MAVQAPPALLQLARVLPVRPLSALTTRPAPLPTSLPPLDALLNGGLPRGAITVLSGDVSSGVSPLALHLLASTQQAGQLAAFLDLPQGFDALAALRAGVRLDDLLLARPTTVNAALSLAYDLLCEGSCGLLVVAIGGTALPEPALHLLSNAAVRSPSALVCLTTPEASVPGAGLRLSIVRSGWEIAGGDYYALRARVTVEAGRGVIAGRSAELSLIIDEKAPCWPAS